MRRPCWYRWIAVSCIAVFLTAGLVMALRTSEADTPGEGSIRIVETPAASADFPDASQSPAGNRIRFPSSPPPDFATRPATTPPRSAAAPASGVTTSGFEAPVSGDRFAAYPVRTAAAEEPIPPTAGLPSGAARISGQPTVAPPRNPIPPMAAAPAVGPYAPPSVSLPANPLPTNGVPSNSLPPNPAATPAAGSPYGPSYSTASLPQPGTALPPSNPASNPGALRATAAPREMPGAAGEFPDATRPIAAPAARSAGGIPATQVPPPRGMGGTTPAHAAAQPHASAPSGGDGTGRPGEKGLEGPQAPALTIEKIAPPEIQIGKAATFEIVVRNTGNSTAEGVEIHDVVPQGTQLISTTPQVPRSPRGDLVWSLGALAPGDEAVVKLEVMPTSEGEIGSVATVHFAAAAGVRTLCTRPEMLIEVQAPRSALAGDDVPIHIRVSNPGTGVATGIVLTEVIPAGLEHEAGGELEYEVGDLQPGQSRELDLTLRAVRPGTAVNLLAGKGDGRLAQEVRTQIEVTAPALTIGIEGPKRRYLERQATYIVTVANPGTAAAQEVELATFLPKGLQFVDADNHGEYDPASHSVRWSLEQLPPREQGSVTLTALPIEPGQQLLRIETSADRGVTARKEEAILVEGAPSIVFQIVDAADPIEVGGETTYEIAVSNQGSKEATNVRLAVNLGEGMKVLEAEGPSKFAVAGRQVQFQPLAQLAPKAEGVFRIRVACQTAGDHRCQVQLLSDDMKTPITKEEGTRVYADE